MIKNTRRLSYLNSKNSAPLDLVSAHQEMLEEYRARQAEKERAGGIDQKQKELDAELKKQVYRAIEEAIKELFK